MIEHETTEINLQESARAALLNHVQDFEGHPYIAPNPKLFPDPFLWDTAIVAIGLRHSDPELAAKILETQTIAQWRNGQIANQTFLRKAGWHETVYQGSNRSQYAHVIPTSGITQPPLLAEGVWQVGQKLPEQQREQFFATMLPKLGMYHRHLLTDQMVNSGLIALKHPYESGMDNSPPWLHVTREAMAEYKQTPRGKVALGIGTVLGPLLRRDTKHTPANERMTTEDIMAYGYLTLRIRQHGYDMRSIVEDPVVPLLEDVAFNAIFARANQRLAQIAEASDLVLPTAMQEKIEEHKAGIEQLWDEETQCYYSRNARTKELVRLETIGSTIMLYSGIIANDRAERLIKHLADEEKFNTPSGPPSTPLDSPYYDPNCYWQGSNWPMTTYCVVEGLENYGEFDGASELRQRNLKLPNSEYAHPETGRALGISPFAPRAGLHLEFAAKEYDELAA